MSARVIDDPPAIECVFSDASRALLDVSYLPCPQLTRDLARGLAGMVHPLGGVNAAGTAKHFRNAISTLARWMDAKGFTGGAADLPRRLLIEFWMAHNAAQENQTRALLRSFDDQTAALAPDTRAYLAGTNLNQRRNRDKKQLAPYSQTEWKQLKERCQAIINTSFAEHRAALELAETGEDPRHAGWSAPNISWLYRRLGPVDHAVIARHMGWGRSTVSAKGGAPAAAERLFPTFSTVLAYRLLLGMTTGIVPDGLDDLTLGDVTWAGDQTILLDYVKGRTGPESLVLPKPAVTVLRRWLRHSELLRSFAPEQMRSNLWLAYRAHAPGEYHLITPTFGSYMSNFWVRTNSLTSDDGSPLAIHKHRIRTTFENNKDKSKWTGRTTIDPNHSAQVEGDNYLSSPTAAQRDMLASVIEDAQADLVRQAHTPVVLRDDSVEDAVAGLPEQLLGLQLTDEVITELVGGQRDVFTAACVDQLAGVHGPRGKPCPARPWVCLLCPLAVFAPRHAPNLLRLKAFFARQFRQMPLAQFMAVFGAYAHRIDHDILPRFAPAVLTAAARDVDGRDDELPLRPEEHTQ